MTCVNSRISLKLFLLLVILLNMFLITQKIIADDIDNILEQIKETNFNEIEDYIVDVIAEIDMKELQVPTMVMRVYFKKPDKIHIESDGFAIMPREGIFINPDHISEENFYISYLDMDTSGVTMMHKIELIPRKETGNARKLIAWIHPDRWTVERLEITTFQGQKSDINFHYQLIESRYWLPDTIKAELTLTGFTGFNQSFNSLQDVDTKVGSQKGYLEIILKNYQINSGLSDSIFEIDENLR